MNVVNLFIADDVFDIIFQKLNYEGKIIFSQINQFTYNRYYPLIKLDISKSLNDDYHSFKRYFRRFTYSHEMIQELGIEALNGIRTCWKGGRGYYDMRYLFELIYHGLNSNDVEIRKNTKNSSLQIIMKCIKRCISFSRSETIHQINKESMLYCLHILFNPTKGKNATIQVEWEKI